MWSCAVIVSVLNLEEDNVSISAERLCVAGSALKHEDLKISCNVKVHCHGANLKQGIFMLGSLILSFLNSISFWTVPGQPARMSCLSGPKQGHQTAASCNERFAVIFIIVSNGSFSPQIMAAFLWLSPVKRAKEHEKNKKVGNKCGWIKSSVLCVLGDTVSVFVYTWGAAGRSEHWQTHRCGCCWWAVLPSLNREIMLDLCRADRQQKRAGADLMGCG